MSDTERYENLVIGSGESGKWITWSLAQAGHRTAVVERKYIGREREKTASNRALTLVLNIHLMLSSASLSQKSGWGR